MSNQNPITINGYSLDSSASVMASRTTHDSAAMNDLSVVKITRRDGAKITNSNYGQKEIVIEGQLLLGSQNAFEQVEDDFKRNVEVVGGNLDIPFWNGTRRYTVTSEGVTINRDSENIEYAPYQLKYVASDPPFGYDPLTTRAYSFSQITTSTYSNSVYFGGSAEPKPTLTFNINSGSLLSDIEFRTTAQPPTRFQFSNSLFSTKDVYALNTANYQLTKNGAIPTDYAGQFPVFTPNAWNGFTLNFTGSAGNAIDQQQLSANFFLNLNVPNSVVAQTFTPAVTGSRVKTDYLLAWISTSGNPYNTVPITAQIRSVAGGVPTATVLATAVIPPGTVTLTNGAIYSAIYQANPTLVSGSTYALCIVGPQTTDSLAIFLQQQSGVDPYGPGKMYLSADGVNFSSLGTNFGDEFFRDWYTAGATAHNIALAFDYNRRWI